MLVVAKRAFAVYFHDGDFLAKPVRFDGVAGAPLAFKRVGVLLLTRNSVLARQELGRFAHDHFGERAEEAVAVHSVHERLIAKPRAPPRPFQEVGHATHRLDAARQHRVRFTREYRLGGKGDGLHAGGAGLVDGEGWRSFRHTRAKGNLPRGIRPVPRLAGMAEYGKLDFLRLDRSARERCLRRKNAELGSREAGEGAAEFADRGARRAQEEYARHDAAMLSQAGSGGASSRSELRMA